MYLLPLLFLLLFLLLLLRLHLEFEGEGGTVPLGFLLVIRPSRQFNPSSEMVLAGFVSEASIHPFRT